MMMMMMMMMVMMTTTIMMMMIDDDDDDDDNDDDKNKSKNSKLLLRGQSATYYTFIPLFTKPLYLLHFDSLLSELSCTVVSQSVTYFNILTAVAQTTSVLLQFCTVDSLLFNQSESLLHLLHC